MRLSSSPPLVAGPAAPIGMTDERRASLAFWRGLYPDPVPELKDRGLADELMRALVPLDHVPFVSAKARDYYFVATEFLEVKTRDGRRRTIVSAIAREVQAFSKYLCGLLTHPDYRRHRQCGFVRVDTVFPGDIQRAGRHRFRFRIAGTVVGRNDLARLVRTRRPPTHTPLARQHPGSFTEYVQMPSRPHARAIAKEAWYEFTPHRWRRDYPKIPLRPPIEVVFSKGSREAAIHPRYDELYRDGVLKIALLFGYDANEHFPRCAKQEIRRILTAPRGERFTHDPERRCSNGWLIGPYTYRGRGLGFRSVKRSVGVEVLRSDRAGGQGARVRYRLTERPLLVGSRGAAEGTVYVRRRPVPAGTEIPIGTLVERVIDVEVLLMDFDRSSARVPVRTLRERFLFAFAHYDVIHFNGHAEYGKGFQLGSRKRDLFSKQDLQRYWRRFPQRYQIYSFGACHAAGYYPDFFYHALRPRKTPDNLDILAAVNEKDFRDDIDGTVQLIRALMQDGPRWRQREPLGYERILRKMAARDAFRAFTGAFSNSGRYEV